MSDHTGSSTAPAGARRGSPERTRPATPTGIVPAIRHVLRHQAMRQRRVWWSPIVSGLAQPTLFLLAIGAGIGSQIDDDQLVRLGADSYMAWIGPGILAVTAMQISANEAMWPTMGLLRWQGSYRAILHTPLAVGDLAVGHLAFIATRATVSATCFLAVLIVAGVLSSVWGLLMPAVAALVGIVHAGPIVALSATIDNDNYFPPMSRAIIFPLFIFSGAFFPVEDMPAWLETVTRFLPSWHGVEACRDLAAGSADLSTLGHVGVLAALASAGVAVARWAFVRSVEP